MKFQKKDIAILTVVTATLILSICVIIFSVLRYREIIKELEQQYETQKGELEEQYEELAIQYEGVNQMNIRNDSIISQLESEKVKVQRLLEELRQVKASDAEKISSLRNELSTLREIMKGFVRTIDSLNRENTALKEENTLVKENYRKATSQANDLAIQREKLEEKVTQASLLDATNIKVTALDSRDRIAKKIKNITVLKINFDITKNITAQVGNRIIYAVITKPDGAVLVKNRTDEFNYQNKKLNYSCRKTIQYDGEQISIDMYWPVEEFLSDGTYQINIFTEGNHIGQSYFQLGK